jgi:PAS domain S-box-containing protein
VRRPSSLLARYSTAIGLVGVFLAIRLALGGLLGQSVPYLQFFPAVMLAAWLGGLGPGLLATALAGLLSAYFFLEPVNSFAISNLADSVSLPLFVAIAGAMVLIVDSQQRAEAAQRVNADLATSRARDLTEAADAISTTRRRLSEIVSNVPGVVWEAWGEPGAGSLRIDFVSEYSRVMLGYDPKQLTSTQDFWLAAIHPEDRERAAAEAAAIYANRGRGRSEFRWVHRDGHVIWVEAHSQVVLDERGQPVGMRGVTLDISDRKQLERERADLLQRERTARADAVAANRLKDDFLATLSHELRTPLNAIVGYTRMLRTGVFDESRRQHALEVVERNAAALTKMVEDVLDVSRIVAGKIRLNVQRVNVAAVLEEAIVTVRPAADARGVAVQATLDADAGAVAGDPERLQQVFWNLLSNAVKFTPRDGRVQIRLARTDSHLEVVVSDTGIGIPAEFLPHVFDRFRQADSRFSREHGGLGLGLAIARELVHLHGGTIEAASEGAGKGATFRVTLPLMAGQGRAERDARGLGAVRPTANAAGDAARLDGVRVLVVDDDRDATNLVRQVLEEAGAAVSVAESAATALSLLQRQPADVLLTDIGMPDVDGFALIAQVRASADGAIRDVPAAALTAYARPEDRVRALKSGFQMHLAKPIDPEELVAAVAALAGRAAHVPHTQ